MGLMSTVVQFVGRHKRRMDSAFPDYVPSCLPTSAVASGPASPVSQSPKPDGLVQLQIRRAILEAEGKRLRNLCRNKKASLIEAELHTVLHRIMWLEVCK